MITTVAILLRGSFVAPALVAVELRKLQRYGHAGILLSDGRFVEASALHNKVTATHHPCEWYNYERVLSLDHLSEEKRENIAIHALAMVGDKYGWRQAYSQTIEGLLPVEPDDSRREICFEVVGRATCFAMTYRNKLDLIDGRDIIDAWRRSREA